MEWGVYPVLATKRSRFWRRPLPPWFAPRHDPFAYVDAADEAKVALKKLPLPHANILRSMAFEGLNQQDIAVSLRCSEMTVSRIVREARSMLRSQS